MVDGHIWDVEAGGSNPLTQARGFYFSISLCHPNKKNKWNINLYGAIVELANTQPFQGWNSGFNPR